MPVKLPLFFLFIFNASAFSQTAKTPNNQEQQTFSKADSLIAASYFTEQDFNELNGITTSNETSFNDNSEGDEIYNNTNHHHESTSKHQRRNRFWEAVAADIIIDVVVNTVFVITAFWN